MEHVTEERSRQIRRIFLELTNLDDFEKKATALCNDMTKGVAVTALVEWVCQYGNPIHFQCLKHIGLRMTDISQFKRIFRKLAHRKPSKPARELLRLICAEVINLSKRTPPAYLLLGEELRHVGWAQFAINDIYQTTESKADATMLLALSEKRHTPNILEQLFAQGFVSPYHYAEALEIVGARCMLRNKMPECLRVWTKSAMIRSTFSAPAPLWISSSEAFRNEPIFGSLSDLETLMVNPPALIRRAVLILERSFSTTYSDHMVTLIPEASKTIAALIESAKSRLEILMLLLSLGQCSPSTILMGVSLIGANKSIEEAVIRDSGYARPIALLKGCTDDVSLQDICNVGKFFLNIKWPRFLVRGHDEFFLKSTALSDLINLDKLDKARLSFDELNILLHICVVSWLSCKRYNTKGDTYAQLIFALLAKGAFPGHPALISHKTARDKVRGHEQSSPIAKIISETPCPCLRSDFANSKSPAPLRCLAASTVQHVPRAIGEQASIATNFFTVPLLHFIHAHRLDLALKPSEAFDARVLELN